MDIEAQYQGSKQGWWGSKIFYGGLKDKVGINCQQCPIVTVVFLISKKYGYASADCLDFEASDVHHWFENGLMKKDSDKKWFVLFGEEYLFGYFIHGDSFS